MSHAHFLRLALKEAMTGMRAREGGPFGAVIVLDGEIIGRGHNTVLKSTDPTAHAEINAIRDACRRLNAHHLTGAVLYTNFEPCPMCLSALYWSDIKQLFYCSGRHEAEKIGFMDNHLYQQFSIDPEEREIQAEQMPMKEMQELLDEWDRMEGKIFY